MTSQPPKTPLVTVIIVNYNGGEMLHNCLSTLGHQMFTDFEVIVIDNGSHDDSMIACDKPRPFPIRSVKLGRNTGYAYGNNHGVRLARGKWLALLNSDAFASPLWLDHLVVAAQNNPLFSFFTSHQIQYNDPGVVDGTGDMYAKNGRAWRRDYGAPLADAAQYDDEVFGACGAAAFIRADIFREVGGFDEDYFCYFEDVDLSLRLRLAGYRCLHAAKAVVYHIGSASSGGEVSDFSIFYGYRNLVWTYFKSMPLKVLLKHFPEHIKLNINQIKEFSRMGKRKLIWKSKLSALLGLPRILLIKRPRVQRLCRVQPGIIDGALVADPHA
jgi:GT2 family glycosyltransferase